VLEIQIQEITTQMTTGRRGQRGTQPYASAWMEPPYGIYTTADGHMAIAQCNLADLARVLASDDLAALATARPDPADQGALQDWRDGVYPLVQRALAPLMTEDAVTRLDAAGIWCGPVMDYDALIAHPQAEGLFATVDHPRAGPIRTLAPAIRFSTQAPAALRGAPALGEHTAAVLRRFAVPEAEIDALMQKGVIA
jgi:crotonobetainyl-CoA:carnitine CoA-transferase CaiB-like acyl-CoA transferase